jgi:drug/metabolite transporter (DMT)-like permease
VKAPPAGLVLLAATVAWGSTFVVTASLLEDAPPLTYLALRFGAATLVLLPLAPRLRASRGLVRDALVLGLLNACGLLLQVFGQCYTTPAKSSFITSLNTPLTALCGLLLYRQVPTRAQRIAIVLATAGLCLLTWPPPGARINPGDLYTVGCAVLYAVFIVESARRAPRHDAITMAVAQVVIAAVLFAGCAMLARSIHADTNLLELEARPFPHGARVLWQMAYMSTVCVAGTMIAQTWALQRLPATTSAVIYSLEPVVATALSMALGDAGPGPRGTTGAVLVLCAVYVAEGRELRRLVRR